MANEIPPASRKAASAMAALADRRLGSAPRAAADSSLKSKVEEACFGAVVDDLCGANVGLSVLASNTRELS